MKVNAREARQRFSELLDRVERGEEIIVTWRARPSMRLEAVHDADTTPTLPELAEFRASLGNTGEPLSGATDYRRADGWMREGAAALRTLDALHLSIASRIRTPLSTADGGLAEAGEALGVAVELLARHERPSPYGRHENDT